MRINIFKNASITEILLLLKNSDKDSENYKKKQSFYVIKHSLQQSLN